MTGPPPARTVPRALAQQRAADEAPGKKLAVLRQTRILPKISSTKVEWQRYVKEGVRWISALGFRPAVPPAIRKKESIRGPPSIKLREQGAELWRWINDGALHLCPRRRQSHGERRWLRHRAGSGLPNSGGMDAGKTRGMNL